jgi:RNA polymerase sigma-70 factor (ECF subfamily)
VNDSSLRGRRPERPKITTCEAGPLDFQAFHALYRGAYVRWASLYLGSRADAEDAVDEAMVELLGKWPTVLTQEEPAAYAWWQPPPEAGRRGLQRDRAAGGGGPHR